jgi:type I restriction enzyme, S subunit
VNAQTIRFRDLLSYPLRSGVTVPKDKRGTGIRMINMGELFRYPRLGDVDMSLVDIDHSDSHRYLVAPGDLLFARRSLTVEGAGKCSIVVSVSGNTTWESSIIRARLDTRQASPEFYYYLFRSPIGRQLTERIVEQVAVAGIRSSDLSNLRVPYPALHDQRAIAAVLGVLDDKIAVNDCIATTTDELLTVLFSRALRDTPGEFIEQPLSRVAEFVNGRAFTKAATGRGRMVVRIAEINSGPGASTVYNEIEVHERHLARPGDVLFAWSGSLAVARWYRPEAIINQHIFKVIPKNNMPLWLAFELVRLKLAEFRAIAAGKATTMGHIQRRHLDEPVPMPTTRFLPRLDAQLKPLWDRALASEQETLALAALRDTLLPQLMSGKLRVRDAERIVEDAV